MKHYSCVNCGKEFTIKINGHNLPVFCPNCGSIALIDEDLSSDLGMEDNVTFASVNVTTCTNE